MSNEQLLDDPNVVSIKNLVGSTPASPALTAPAPKKRGRPPKKVSNNPSADNGFIALGSGDTMFAGPKAGRVLDADEPSTRAKRQKTDIDFACAPADSTAISLGQSSDHDDGLSDYERSALRSAHTAGPSGIASLDADASIPPSDLPNAFADTGSTALAHAGAGASVPYLSFGAVVGESHSARPPVLPAVPADTLRRQSVSVALSTPTLVTSTPITPYKSGADTAPPPPVNAAASPVPVANAVSAFTPSTSTGATLDKSFGAVVSTVSAPPPPVNAPASTVPVANVLDASTPSTSTGATLDNSFGTVVGAVTGPPPPVDAPPSSVPVTNAFNAFTASTSTSTSAGTPYKSFGSPVGAVIAASPAVNASASPVPVINAFNTSTPSTPTGSRITTPASVFPPTSAALSSSPASPPVHTPSAPGSTVYQSFGAAVVAVAPSSSPLSGTSSPARYRRQRNIFQVRDLPAVCEVTDASLHDVLLAQDYSSLPKLKFGTLTSWSPKVGAGQLMFSSWGGIIPDMNVNFCLNAIRFEQSGQYINPSRVSPLVVNISRSDDIGFRNQLCVDTMPAVCVSSVVVKACHLVDPIERENSKRQKSIVGVFHCQEWQRMQAFFAMVFDKPRMQAQLFCDMLSFSTMPEDKDLTYNSSRASRAGQYKKDSRQPEPGPSNDAAEPSQDSVTKVKSVLAFEDDVPVYDGRFIAIDFQNDLPRLHEILPPFHGPDGIDVPPESFAVIGYTVGNYRKQGVDPDVPMPA